MTPQQLQYYNQIVTYLMGKGAGYKFCLDKQTYQSVFPNVTLSKSDKIAISKHFKQQVANNIINVDFDYIFSNCARCGYKDSQNHIHYVTK